MSGPSACPSLVPRGPGHEFGLGRETRGDADDRDEGDGQVLHQEFLDLARMDIEAATDDHIATALANSIKLACTVCTQPDRGRAWWQRPPCALADQHVRSGRETPPSTRAVHAPRPRGPRGFRKHSAGVI